MNEKLATITTQDKTTGARYLLSGNTGFLTTDGEVFTVEELSGECYTSIDVLALDGNGRLGSTTVHSFVPEAATRVTKAMTFASGLSIELCKDAGLFSPAREQLKVDDVEFGSLVSGVIYDPFKTAPSYSADAILHMHVKKYDEPQALFGFWSSKPYMSILVTQNSNQGKKCPLIAVSSR